MWSGNLEIGDVYEKLKNGYQINFVDHVNILLDEHPLTRYYFTSEHDLSKKILTNQFCFIIVRIDKIKELAYNETRLMRWLKFLSSDNQEERNKLAKGDDLLMKLNSWVYEHIHDEKTIHDLEKVSQELMDEQLYLAGKSDGVQQRNMEIVKNMLHVSMSIEDISKITGLSKEEIEKIKETK